MLEVLPGDVTEQTARDYFQFRKKAKGGLNTTIWNKVLAELEACRLIGIDGEKALAEAMMAGWQGFKVDWLAKRLGMHLSGSPPGQPQSAVLHVPTHTQDMYPDDRF